METVQTRVTGLRNAAVQLLSRTRLSGTPRTAAHQAPLSSATSRSLLKPVPSESVMLSNHLILCCPHHLLLLPSVIISIRAFSNELALSHHVAKVLELQHQFFQ